MMEIFFGIPRISPKGESDKFHVIFFDKLQHLFYFYIITHPQKTSFGHILG